MNQPSEIPEWAMEQAEAFHAAVAFNLPPEAVEYARALLAAYQRGRESMVEEFKKWEMAVRTEEREQCAQRCEAVERDNPAFDERDKGFCEAATECARVIREGGK